MNAAKEGREAATMAKQDSPVAQSIISKAAAAIKKDTVRLSGFARLQYFSFGYWRVGSCMTVTWKWSDMCFLDICLAAKSEF